jgi:ElaB/YqjD/DUF883 family membrane-anchored ribosome-binding protein
MTDENLIGQVAPIPPQAGEKAERGMTHARDAAEDLRSAAGAMADEYPGHAEGVWDDTRRRVHSLQDDSKQYIRKNPTRAVVTALGVGFVVGFTFGR